MTDERGSLGTQDDATTHVVPVQEAGTTAGPAQDGDTTQVVPVAPESAFPEQDGQPGPGQGQPQGSLRLGDLPGEQSEEETTRVISTADLAQAPLSRSVPVRPGVPARPAARPDQRVASRAPARRRARLALKRIDPWSVFVLAFLVSVFLAVVLLVAVFVLYALLDSLGVLSAVDTFARDLEIVEPEQSLLGLGRVLAVAGTIAVIDVVLLTVLATLGAFLYNLCAALTGGIEVVLAERE